MPIFEYECSKGHRFEKLERNGNIKSRTCPECGNRAPRILSPTGFILKGEGFYVNDYPSSSRRASMNKGEDASCDLSSSCEAPTGSCPAKDQD
jgi:putative FmdB family regulatory protein